MGRFDSRIAVRFGLAADSIIGRRRRLEANHRKTRQVLAQAEHFSHALPGPVQDEYDQPPAGWDHSHPFFRRLLRKIERIFARKKQHGKPIGAVKLAMYALIRGEIHSFHKQRIAQAEMGHTAGSETMLRLTRLRQYDETNFRIESLDKGAITKRTRPAARMALRAIRGSIDVTAG